MSDASTAKTTAQDASPRNYTIYKCLGLLVETKNLLENVVQPKLEEALSEARKQEPLNNDEYLFLYAHFAKDAFVHLCKGIDDNIERIIELKAATSPAENRPITSPSSQGCFEF